MRRFFRLTLLPILLLALSFEARAAQEPIVVGKYRAHPTRIIAKYADAPRLQSSGAALESLGLAVQRRYPALPGLVVLDLQEAQAKKLANVSEAASAAQLVERIRALQETGAFEYVQPSYVYTNLLTPNDLNFRNGTLWGLRNTGIDGGTAGADIDAVHAWDITTGSTNVIVAVIDTGIRYTHEELYPQMWVNPNEVSGNNFDDDNDGYRDDIFGINAARGNGDPFDDNDHGSHVAGTIGAAANDGNPHVGVAWHVRLMACKFLEADGFGMTEDAITCVNYAVEHGARIINASWAGAPFDRALYDTLAAARKAGVLILAGAGNDGSDNDRTPVYPASYKLDNIITIAAVDRKDRLAWFSNYGRSSVHLAAPGDEIFSTTAETDLAYSSYSGTSMATPHVAGVAALILAKYPDASVPEMRTRLLSTAVQIPTLSGMTVTGGRLNAFRALSAAPDGVLELALDPPEGSDLSARRPVTFSVTVTDLSSVTNATVRARITGSSEEIVFRNDGVTPDFKGADEVYTAEVTLPATPGPFGIEFTVAAPGKTPLTQSVSYNIASPPLNDNFADAFELPGEGAFVQWTNRFGTLEPGEPLHAQVPSAAASVWWNWTPAKNTSVIVDTTGSSFDTIVGVYTNSPVNKLKEVASADDGASQKQAYVIFEAKAGVVYHIAVAGFSAPDAGAIRLRVEPGGNIDTVAPVLTVTSPASGLVLTNANDPKVTITGTAADPLPNASGVRQVQVQVNRDVASTATGTTNWSSTVLLREGQNRIRVVAHDYAGNSSPTRTITVTYQLLISPNDALTNAVELVGLEDTVTGNNSRASKEPGEPLHAGVAGGKSIWWKTQPTTDGLLTLNTVNSTFNTLLALYSGPATQMSGLKLIASNDDALRGSDFSKIVQPIKGGQTYCIAVDGFNGATGLVQLAYSLIPTTVWTLNASAAGGGTVSPTNGFYQIGDRAILTATPDQFYVFDRWDGSVTSRENPLALAMEGDMQLVARFAPVEFSEGFESGNLSKLSWRTSGNLPWVVQTNVVQAGKFAARSGSITNGQRTSLILTGLFRAGTGSFGVRVSSEQTWDVLEFFVNGRSVSRWSGEVPWTPYSFSTVSGTNMLEWRYSKDFLNTKAGLDAAFIDNLDLPLVIQPDSSTPAHLDITHLLSGAVRLDVHGQTNQMYILQNSADLKVWQPVATNVAKAGLYRWDGAIAPNQSRAFYRAVSP